MGISGLLPLLKDVSEDVHVSKYKGKVVGIDAYVWLHRGAYGCAEALALGRPTTRYVEYAMANIRMLQHHGVTPYLVFDGDRLPAKAGTESDRQQRRADSLAQAKLYLSLGKRREAHEQYTRCVDVTPAMAFQLIKRLREDKVDYIVAPYEADAQLTYLEKNDVIQAIVTEDSDLLVFGCDTVLYKMDKDGNCVEVKRSRIAKCKALPMHAFNVTLFRQMAILSGCDYLPSIPKMGLKTAHNLLRQCGTVARVLAVAGAQGMNVPEGYRNAFQRAERTFVYQRVFHRTETGEVQMRMLTSPKDEDADVKDDDCIGPLMSAEHARGIAYGDIDPISRKPIEDPSRGQTSSSSSAKNGERKSFYSQTPFLQGKGKKATPKCTLIAGQGKLDGFFSKGSSSAGTSKRQQLSARQPLSSVSSNRLDRQQRERPENGTMGREAKRGRVEVEDIVEETTLHSPPVMTKSKYFSTQTQTASVSPTKSVYGGPVELASFSTPTQAMRQRRRGASEDSSDGGLISSPGSTYVAKTLPREAKTTTTVSPTLQRDLTAANPAPSSPYSSPPLSSQSSLLDNDDNKGEDVDTSASNIFARFRYAGAIPTDFQTPMSALNASISTARRNAAATGALSTLELGGSVDRKPPRALSMRWDEDPFDDKPKDGGRESIVTMLSTSATLPAARTPSHPFAPAAVARSNSGRKLQF